jgi:hypothetical protein
MSWRRHEKRSRKHASDGKALRHPQPKPIHLLRRFSGFWPLACG